MDFNLKKMERPIDWERLKESFFKECTTETPRKKELKKVSMSPISLFEWFKNEINEYLK